MARLIEKIEMQNKSSSGGSHRLFVAFCDIFEKEYHPCDTRMVKAREYIDLNFVEAHCLESACRSCGLS